MYVVGFNGPPHCGKDTLAQMLADHMDSQRVDTPIAVQPLSFPLRLIAHQMVGRNYDPHDYESFKQEPFPEFDGKDGRRLMIDVSEGFLKPTYGDEILTKMFLARLAETDFDGIVLVPDNGFMIEASAISEAVGQDNYYVVRVHRDGCDFSKDSREWVYATHDMDLDNTGTLNDLRTEAGRIYGRLVNQMRWKL